MGTPIKNLIFGGGSAPKKGNISGLVFGDNSKKPKKSSASQLIFGGPKKKGRSGAAGLVFGDKTKVKKRSGFSALVFGTGTGGRYEPDDIMEAESKRINRRMTKGDYNERSVIYKRLKKYNQKHTVRGKARVGEDKIYRNTKIEKGELADIMKKVAEEERFTGRTESSAQKQIADKKLHYKDEEGNIVEMKLDRSTRRRLDKMATIRDFERPVEEIPQEIKNARIAASRATSSLAQEKNSRRNDPRANREHGEAGNIGAKELKDIKSSVSASAAIGSAKSETSAGSNKGHSSSIEQGKDAGGVASSGLGANKKIAEEDKSGGGAETSAGASSQPVVISGGSGVSRGSQTETVKRNTMDNDDLFYSGGQGLGLNLGKSPDFKKLIEEKKAADGYEEEKAV